MNKTDTILWLMRAHEAVRKLPESAVINGVDLTLYGNGNRVRIFLDGETEIGNIVTRQVIRYNDSNSGRVDCSDSNGVDYWWGVDFDDDGHVIPRA